MNLSRRHLIKATVLGLLAMPFLGLAKALQRSDTKVKAQGYIHDVFQAANPEHKDHKKLSKIKPYKKFKTDKFIPKCDNCKHYKAPEGDYGTCTMVGARGKRPGQFVFKNGLCKVYAKLTT